MKKIISAKNNAGKNQSCTKSILTPLPLPIKVATRAVNGVALPKYPKWVKNPKLWQKTHQIGKNKMLTRKNGILKTAKNLTKLVSKEIAWNSVDYCYRNNH